MPFVHIPDPDKTDEDRRRDEREINRLLVIAVFLMLCFLALFIYLRAQEEQRYAQMVEECRADPEGCVAQIREAEKEAEGKISGWWLLLMLLLYPGHATNSQPDARPKPGTGDLRTFKTDTIPALPPPKSSPGSQPDSKQLQSGAQND